jgi:hypothetical protein
METKFEDRDYYTIEEREDEISVWNEYTIGNSRKRDLIGSAKGWKKDPFARAISVFREREENKYKRAVKIKIYVNVLHYINDEKTAYDLINIINGLSFIELIFWDWKFNDASEKIIKSFLLMYKGDSGI